MSTPTHSVILLLPTKSATLVCWVVCARYVLTLYSRTIWNRVNLFRRAPQLPSWGARSPVEDSDEVRLSPSLSNSMPLYVLMAVVTASLARDRIDILNNRCAKSVEWLNLGASKSRATPQTKCPSHATHTTSPTSCRRTCVQGSKWPKDDFKLWRTGSMSGVLLHDRWSVNPYRDCSCAHKPKPW